jgi:hypothetical protein
MLAYSITTFVETPDPQIGGALTNVHSPSLATRGGGSIDSQFGLGRRLTLIPFLEPLLPQTGRLVESDPRWQVQLELPAKF